MPTRIGNSLEAVLLVLVFSGFLLSSDADGAGRYVKISFAATALAYVTEMARRLRLRLVLVAVFLAAGSLASTGPVWAGGSGPAGGHNCPPRGNPSCGDPITIGTGNLFQEATDYSSGGQNRITLTRYYNSQLAFNFFGSFGFWRSNYDSFIYLSPGNGYVDTILPDNKSFYLANSPGAGPADIDVRLRLACGQFTCTYLVTDWNDTIYTYGRTEPFLGSVILRLTQIRYRNGYTQTVQYINCGQPNCPISSVTDSYGRSLVFNYQAPNGGGLVASVTTPDGQTISYGYDTQGDLSNVTYPTQPSSSINYLYADQTWPHALTTIVDENGGAFANWTYDDNNAHASFGFALTSQLGTGAQLTSLSYPPGPYANSIPPTVTVTNALGLQTLYKFSQFPTPTNTAIFAFVPLSMEEDRLATPAVGAAKRVFTYDPNGYVASETDWDGNLTTYVNDARGNETSRTLASGTPLAETITTAWHPTFHLPTQISEPGRTTSFSYDANGNLLSKTIASATITSTWSYTYNSFGQVLTATDPNGNVTTYAYDGQGNIISVTNALGQTTQFTSYDANGRPLTIQDPNGVVTALTYNFRGQVTSRTTLQWVTTYNYDAVGQLIKLTKPDGSYLTFTYDAAHRLTDINDALGAHIHYTLDAASNRTQEQVFDASNTLVRTRSYAYDAVNRLTQAIGALGQTTSYSYDPQGNLTQATDPNGNATSNAYDALNRLVQTTDPKGAVTAFGYDLKGRLASVTDPRGLVTSYANNGLDLPTSVTSPDSGVTTNTYDPAGNVLTSTDARGKTTTYVYDALNRVVKQTFANGASVAFQYDQGAYGIGHLTGMTDQTGTTSWGYNRHGQVISKQQTIGAVTLTTRSAYNPATGQLTSITYPSGATTSYSYDANGRVSAIAYQPAGGGATSPLVSQIVYQPFGPAASWVAGSGASYVRAYDQDGRIASLSLPAGDSISLAYDAGSRITSLAETGLPTKSFQYNRANRLVIYASGGTSQTTTYDLSGNRLAYSSTGASPVSLSYAYDPASNRLLGVSGSLNESYSYDAAGNVVAHNTPAADYAFSFSARNRLAQVSVGAIVTTYWYNGLGQRVSKLAQATGAQVFFVYDEAGHLLGRYNSSGGVDEETVYLGDLPVAVLEPGGPYYIAPDHLGSPHQITNGGQQVVWFWDHDPFGNGQPTGALTSYKPRFPGQFYDAETGLHYNYFRDYDPTTGRYIESDPIGLTGGINTYAYVGGKPSLYVDIFGLSELCKCLMERGADSASDALFGRQQEEAAKRILGPELSKGPAGDALASGLVGLIGGAGTGAIGGATAGTILGIPVLEGGGVTPAAGALAGAIAGGTVGGAVGLVKGALKPLFERPADCEKTSKPLTQPAQTTPSSPYDPTAYNGPPINSPPQYPGPDVQLGPNSGFGDPNSGGLGGIIF